MHVLRMLQCPASSKDAQINVPPAIILFLPISEKPPKETDPLQVRAHLSYLHVV